MDNEHDSDGLPVLVQNGPAGTVLHCIVNTIILEIYSGLTVPNTSLVVSGPHVVLGCKPIRRTELRGCHILGTTRDGLKLRDTHTIIAEILGQAIGYECE